MFFMIGSISKNKKIDLDQQIICDVCGSYGRYNVYMTYDQFYLFFIPVFKFRKRYFARTSCCESLYEISKDIGSDLERGFINQLYKDDLSPISLNKGKKIMECSKCRYKIKEDYTFCPNCGNKL